MNRLQSRRRFLTVAGSLGLLAAASQPGAAQVDPCKEVERLEGLTGEGASRDEIEPLLHEIMRLHAEQSERRFEAATHEAAVDVGTTVRESVAYVEDTGTGSGHSAGGHYTAWFVEPHLLLTNAHNVDTPAGETVGITVDGDTFGAEVVDYVADRSPDVALLRTEYAGTPLSTGESSDLSAGDPLVMVGQPGGFGSWTITLGSYEGRSENIGSAVMKAELPGLSGSSGSPVVGLDGHVRGMLFATQSDTATGPADPRPQFGLLTSPETAELVPIEAALEKLEAWR